MTQTIEQLTAKVAELEEENAKLHEQVDLQVPKTAFTQLKEQLAAAQEQIANETAEACAAYCEAYDLANTTRSGTFCAQSIRRGAWKEFKK